MSKPSDTITAASQAEVEDRGHLTLLFFIVLVGLVLRGYSLTDLAFMHDELSALHRLSFRSFSSLIEFGVLPDGHPAGVQVFLYYWCGLVGESTIAVKLPSIILGAASVPLLYLVGRDWFSAGAGLVAAALLASLQFPILYSQLGRPYSYGLFFSLLMVYGWSQIVLQSSARWSCYFYFLLGLLGCAYVHYFAHLLGVIVCISGIVLVDRTRRARYVGTVAVAVLLYLPHVPILLGQLQTGGLQWLARPKPYFVWEHLCFIFTYSLWPVGIVLGLWLAGRFTQVRREAADGHGVRVLLCLLWFAIPIGVGYTYSVLRAPVLQHSVLLFSAPYLFLFFGALAQYSSQRFLSIGIVCLLLANTVILVSQRQHYDFMLRQPHSQFYSLTKGFIAETADSADALVLFDENPAYLDRYFSPGDHSYISLYGGEVDEEQVRSLIAGSEAEYIVLGNIPRKWLPLARKHFPYLCERHVGFTFEYYIYGKSKPKQAVDDLLYTVAAEWSSMQSTDRVQLLDIEVPAVVDNYDFVEVVVTGDSDTPLFVEQLMVKDEPVRRVKARLTASPPTDSAELAALITSRLIHHIRPTDQVNDYRLQLYVLKDSTAHVQGGHYTISFYEGNALVYGLFKKI